MRRLPSLEHMMIRARYRYILEANSPLDGGWVRWFENFDSAEEALEQGYELFAPMAGFSGAIHLDMRVRKIIVFLPRRR